MAEKRSTAQEQHLLQEGLDCLRRGAFFDAHEHWEITWMTMSGQRRSFWQAMIQLSVGAYHFQQGNLNGCLNLWRKALHRVNVIIAYRLAVREAPVLALRKVLLACLECAVAGSDPLSIIQVFAVETVDLQWLDFY